MVRIVDFSRNYTNSQQTVGFNGGGFANLADEDCLWKLDLNWLTGIKSN